MLVLVNMHAHALSFFRANATAPGGICAQNEDRIGGPYGSALNRMPTVLISISVQIRVFLTH